MLIEYRNGRFEAISSFTERLILKEKGFRWDSNLRLWWTNNPVAVKDLPLGESAVKEIRSRQRVAEMSRAGDHSGEFAAPPGLAYRPYQKAGIAYGLEHASHLNADRRGLGKTIQAIGVLNNADEWRRALIVAPAKLTHNWRKELGRWLLRDQEVIITSWAQLHKHTRSSFDWMVADEAHYARSPKSRRSKAFLQIQAKRVIALSGTPRVNGTLDLWPLIQKIRPDLFPSWFKFAERYCDGKRTQYGFVAEGSTNEQELNEILRAEMMIRRDIEDVLGELPELTREIIYLERDAKVSEALRRFEDLTDAQLMGIEDSVGFEETSAIRKMIGDRFAGICLIFCG